MENKNILILSVGTRNKIVQYFRENFKEIGKVVCTDMSKYAPALYDADTYYISPSLENKNYFSFILDICEKENIDGIFSLIDPELEKLAENKALFDQKNIRLLQSPLSSIKTSFNKYEFYNTLTENGFPSQKSYIDLESVIDNLNRRELDFPLFVKPNTGSSSLNINKVKNRETLKSLFSNHDDLIVQEFIDGKEFGIDVYIDFISKEVISIFIKEKIKMRSGETDKSISVKDDSLMVFIEDFVLKMGYLGQIDIDVFLRDGNYYISEVNPRFGGGYPHAYNAGCNFPEYIINNLNGKQNTPEIGNYSADTAMMKYNELKFIESEVHSFG